MSATAIMTSNSKNTILWVDMIRSRFGPKYQFEWKQMGAILLIVVIDTMLPDVKFDGF